MKKLFVLFVFGIFALSASLSNAVPAPGNEYYYNPETHQCINHMRGDENVRNPVPDGFYFSGYDDVNCTQKIFNLTRYEDCKSVNGKYVMIGLLLYECHLEQNNVSAKVEATGNATGENVLETSAGTLPDSPFYGLKKFGEGIQLFFTFDQVEKAKLKYKLAQLRLVEAETMARLNKIQLAENALKDYETGLNETEADENLLSAAGRNISSIADLVGNNTYKHILVLQKVYEKVPDSAKPAIRKVIEKSMERQSKIAERVADKGLVNITITIGNQTITRAIPAKLAEKFLENARELKDRTGEEVEIEDEDELKEKIAEKIEIAKGKAMEQIEEVKEDMAELEGKITADTNITALARIISEARIRLNASETAFSQNNFRESYRHAILAEKAAKVAERIIEKAENIEKIIAEKMEVRKDKAQEQIADAKKQINITELKLANITNTAANKLLNQAKEHLNKAETAFNSTKYGDAFGQAVAAEQLAKNAERLAVAREKISEKRSEIKQTINRTDIQIPKSASSSSY